jgi:hypothetical protein
MGSEDFKLAFNRGVVDKIAFGRADIKRLALSAETQKNWLPRAMGPMSLRPGTKYITSSQGDAATRMIPFVFALGDTALIELTNLSMRVLVNDTVITRASVSTAVTNGLFTSDLSGWTDTDSGTAVSSWLSGGYLSLLGDGTLSASRKQTLTVSGSDQDVEHALNIVVTRGFVTLRVGSTDGDDNYISETTLAVGQHSLAFTPTGASVFIELFNRGDYAALVDSCVVASSGAMTLTTTITAAILNDIRHSQSGDVIFMPCGLTHRTMRIERRGTNSWSIVDYVNSNGPYRAPNISPTTITPSALKGTVTLTASKALFKSTNVGSLYSLTSVGQDVASSLSAQNTFTNPIRVSGVTSGRVFNLTITGTWAGTVTLQRSVGAVGAWTDVESHTTNQNKNYDDTFDNQIIYYRIGIKTGEYTSGTAVCSLTYAGGTTTGHARVVGFTSATVVDAIVLTHFGKTDATDNWKEGRWSDRRGFPSAVEFFGARLWLAGKDRTIGSVVDDFSNHDQDYVGDAGPIDRSIGTGPVDKINWLIQLQQLVAGGQGAEFLCRSSSLEEPLTPTNFNLRESTTYGSNNVAAVKIDASAVFVDRTATRVMEVVTDAAAMETGELTVLSHDICKPGIVRIAVQRRPETTVHLVRSDGVAVLLVFDRAEEVKAFVTYETDGLVEDVVVIPGTIEDSVYYVVNRTINGATKRYIEKWALQSETTGGTTDNKMLDSFLIYSGGSTTSMTGLTHLEGEAVYVWANGVDSGPYTVSSGAITLGTATTHAIIGLRYEALFKSTKIGYSTLGPKSMSNPRRVTQLGFTLTDSHNRALHYGTDETHLNVLPKMKKGKAVTANEVFAFYDEDAVSVNGVYDVDSRLVLKAVSPLPCTVATVTVFIEDGRTKSGNTGG